MGKVSDLSKMRREAAISQRGGFMTDVMSQVYRDVAKFVQAEDAAHVAESFRAAHDDLVKLFDAERKVMRREMMEQLQKDLNRAVSEIPPAEHTIEKTTERVIEQEEVPREPMPITVSRNKDNRLSKLTGGGITWKVTRNDKGLITGVKPNV
jgi:hypothetical protein